MKTVTVLRSGTDAVRNSSIVQSINVIGVEPSYESNFDGAVTYLANN